MTVVLLYFHKNVTEIKYFLTDESISRSHIERQGSFGSRRSSINDSILWIHKTSSGELIEGKLNFTTSVQYSFFKL